MVYGDRAVCAPVEMSPAIDWSLMEPKFWIANCVSSSTRSNWKMRIPALNCQVDNPFDFGAAFAGGAEKLFFLQNTVELVRCTTTRTSVVKSEGEIGPIQRS